MFENYSNKTSFKTCPSQENMRLTKDHNKNSSLTKYTNKVPDKTVHDYHWKISTK